MSASKVKQFKDDIQGAIKGSLATGCYMICHQFTQVDFSLVKVSNHNKSQTSKQNLIQQTNRKGRENIQ